MAGNKARFFGFSILIWITSIYVALKIGAVSDAPWDLVAQTRLPRVLLASFTGMGLAVAGAALQALFANPLCEPYTLGISSGAALGAVLGVSLGLEWNVAGMAGSAFAGAILFTAVLLLLSFRLRDSSVALLLSGVMLGFLGTSMVAVWLSLAEPNGMQTAMGWLFGDLSRARMKGVFISGGLISGLSLMIWRNWRALDALLLGEEGAASVGVDLAAIRRQLVLLTSLLVAVCVSGGGMIGFIGLVVPHFARRWVGSMHLGLIPTAAFWGGISLVLADCGARFMVRPYELPVGVVTALFGAPFFMLMMLRRMS